MWHVLLVKAGNPLTGNTKRHHQKEQERAMRRSVINCCEMTSMAGAVLWKERHASDSTTGKMSGKPAQVMRLTVQSQETPQPYFAVDPSSIADSRFAPRFAGGLKERDVNLVSLRNSNGLPSGCGHQEIPVDYHAAIESGYRLPAAKACVAKDFPFHRSYAFRSNEGREEIPAVQPAILAG